MCLAHATPEEQAVALRLVAETGAIDARGVPMTSELLKQLLAASPRDADGRVRVQAAFRNATFDLLRGPPRAAEVSGHRLQWAVSPVEVGVVEEVDLSFPQVGRPAVDNDPGPVGADGAESLKLFDPSLSGVALIARRSRSQEETCVPWLSVLAAGTSRRSM
jgi:hypothetical protein